MIAEQNVEAVLEHLLFHKAIIDEGDRTEKIDRYLTILDQKDEGEVMYDPGDDSSRMVFDLVLTHNFDPWEIDLLEFTRLYSGKIANDDIDFIVAGRLLHMAWSILRMQSEEVLSAHDREEMYFADWDMDGLNDMFPEEDVLDLTIPNVKLTEVVRHHALRPVSLVELLDAFEGARKDAELNVERRKARELLKQQEEKFDDKAHDEDLEKDVDMIWQRIQRCGTGAITISDICEANLEDRIRAFISILFLARDGKLSIWQDDLPYGEIFIEMKVDWDIGRLEDLGQAAETNDGEMVI